MGGSEPTALQTPKPEEKMKATGTAIGPWKRPTCPGSHLNIRGWKFGTGRGPHSSIWHIALGGPGEVDSGATSSISQKVQNWL